MRWIEIKFSVQGGELPANANVHWLQFAYDQSTTKTGELVDKTSDIPGYFVSLKRDSNGVQHPIYKKSGVPVAHSTAQ